MLAEVKELNELIDLYVASNPDYASKTEAATKITSEDVNKAAEDSVRLVAQV